MVYSKQLQYGDGVGVGVGDGHGSPPVQSSQFDCSTNETPKPT